MKIAIIGAAGGIGQSLSMLLKLKLPAGSILSLHDISSGTPGIAEDLSHIPTDVSVVGHSGIDPSLALVGADIVIITAGVARKPGMDRADLFAINAGIVKQVVEVTGIVAPHACIGIVTNPVNAMVPVAAEVLKRAGTYDRDKLFGITTLDQTRSMSFLKGKISGTPEVPVIGGHSSSTILPLFSQIKGCELDESEISDITHKVRNAGTVVVNAKDGNGSATLSMAHAACEFCLSLVKALSGTKGIVVYSYVEGNLSHTPFFSQPVELGPWGIEKHLSYGELSLFEEKSLQSIVGLLMADIQTGIEYINQTAA